MIPIDVNGLRYYQFGSLPTDAVIHGIFTRLGGISKPPFASLNLSVSVPDAAEAVAENRSRFYQAMEIDPRQVVRAHQVHGARVAVVGPEQMGVMQRETDGMVTDAPGLALVMSFADCVPVMLYDPVRRVVGMAHAGWRGAVAGVCQAAVMAMVDTMGCRPANIRAAIGPSIGPCCYEVGPDLVEAVSAVFGSAETLFRPGSNGRLHFDQWAAAHRALCEAGVEQVEPGGLCTACHVDEFYSHRAERGRTGRFGAVIALRARV